MKNKLCIAACSNIAPEIQSALNASGNESVEVIHYPALCIQRKGWKDAVTQALSLIPPDCEQTIFIGTDSCLPEKEALAMTNNPRIYNLEQCFHLLVSKSLTQKYLNEGAYLLTPGWLKNWQDYLEQWGFKRDDASEFFRDFAKKLVLLDSRLNETEPIKNIEDLSEYLQIPYEVIPVGLDHLILIINSLILEWKLSKEKEQVRDTRDYANSQLADYAMILDIMSKLYKATNEEEIISNILDLFTMLFAPQQLSYIPIIDGKTASPVYRGDKKPCLDKLREIALLMKAPYRWHTNRQGFLLRLGQGQDCWGVLDVAGITFSEHKNRYLNVALNITGVCGLAISNARQYKKIKQTEEAIAEEKERLLVTLHSIADGVITTDAAGIIQLINPVAAELTGWKQNEAYGKSLEDVLQIINEISGDECENPVTKVLETSRHIKLRDKAVLVAKTGTERHIVKSAAPILDKSDNVLGIVLVFRDVTEDRRIQEEMLRSNKLESVSTLAGGIAHDFNNLLTVILGNLSLAKLYADENNKVMAKICEIEKAAKNAQGLTKRLLTISKGGAPIKKVTNLGPLIREWAEFVLSGSNVACDYDLPHDLHPVEIDQGQLNQAINNLLLNAKEAMPNGGSISVKACNVTFSGEGIHSKKLAEGKYLRISFQDQGKGIPPTIIDRVFDPFFTTKPEGSGLGLFTAYSIIKHHNGTIEVTSEIDAGTVFTIHLPVSEACLPEELPVTNIPIKSKGKVLVMDDDQMIRAFADEMLKYLGYDVGFASDGAEAIRKYQSALNAGKPYDVVIMDLTVRGGMGGKEAFDELIKIDPEIKGIVSSGYSDDPIMAHHSRYGFKKAISKPYQIEEMANVLNELINT